MGKNVVVIGTHWGDEGKGKVVDLLTENVAAVVRFQAKRECRSDGEVQLRWAAYHARHRVEGGGV